MEEMDYREALKKIWDLNFRKDAKSLSVLIDPDHSSLICVRQTRFGECVPGPSKALYGREFSGDLFRELEACRSMTLRKNDRGGLRLVVSFRIGPSIEEVLY